MIISCDNCSVSLQLDESKVPNANFTVRCPRCQNLVRVQGGSAGKGSASVHQLELNKPAPAFGAGQAQFSEKEAEFQVNSALRSLLTALQKENSAFEAKDEEVEKPRRVLLCLSDKYREKVAKALAGAGFKVYLAQTPAQANERLREGKTEVLMLSPDFAAEFGGAAIVQQKVNAMPASERRRLFLALLEEKGTTLNAHEAMLRNLNLIINVTDIEQVALILGRALRDFNELYRYYNKALNAAAL